jgi:hypothetical protein
MLVAGTQLEQWWPERTRERLREIVQEWVGREELLRLSDATLGPDDDIDAAIEHLVRLIERGDLLAVRVAEPGASGSMRAGDGASDAPRLADLMRDRPTTNRSDAARTRATGDRDPRGVAGDPFAGGAADRPTDTWSTFVAFVVVDQDGKPLRGSSRCTIDGAPHTHALGDAAIEIEPIGAHARVVLELTGLEKTEAPA